MILVGLALAEPTRTEGDAADARRDWTSAVLAWRACAEQANDRDARYCATRVEALAPHAADAFAGWDILEGVRRDYRTLGSDAALARVQAALATMPGSPAAPAMRLWLQNEHTRRGEKDAAAALAAEILADPNVPAATQAFVADREAMYGADAQRRVIGLACTAIAGVYVLAALITRGPVLWRPAGTALIFLAAPPAVYSMAYDASMGYGFFWSGLVATGCVLLAGRAPVAVAVAGTLGAFGAIAWVNGWYASLGL